MDVILPPHPKHSHAENDQEGNEELHKHWRPLGKMAAVTLHAMRWQESDSRRRYDRGKRCFDARTLKR